MAISHADFDSENELQTWAFANAVTFFGPSILLPGFRITTPAGKHGVPDGFAFNVTDQSWWVVECELLAHGVWPHIAEQITRFVVAARNPSTLRQVRDKLFERILADNSQEAVAASLGTNTARLMQQLELFIESVKPSLTLFIDDTNQDLSDFCNALDMPTAIYRVRKFTVNGVNEYYSPDRNLPAVTFDADSEREQGSLAFNVIEQLGGGEVVSSRQKCYRLTDGRIVKVQYSKLYERHQAYWYGLNPPSIDHAEEIGCTHMVFILGTEGFVVVPLDIIRSFMQTAYVTRNPDGTLRHYHLHISPPPDVCLKGYANAPDENVSNLFTAFD